MKLVVYCAAACALVISVPLASADLTARVRFTDSYGSGNGGEFRATPTNFAFDPPRLTGNSYFETFCLERDESIGFNRNYYADFTDRAIGGGGGPNPDPLDVRTAYIYSLFVNHDLDGYNYGTGSSRVRSANALQNVIWYLEDEITNLHSGLSWSERNLADDFLAIANATQWTTIRNVRVMNVYENSNGTGNRQDQLVVVPVPVPGAALLGLVGLSAIRFVRRRFG